MTSTPIPESEIADNSNSQPIPSDELLPPVEPPSAGFIVQLFVVPALIVLAVFLLVMAIGWMRSGKEDPIAKVAALRKGNQARWQQAYELAQMMVGHEGSSSGLKDNTELAQEVSQLLDEEIDTDSEDDSAIDLRCYLCRILGEFNLDDGLGTLLKAASEDTALDVRREAINALAVLGHSFNNMDPPQSLSHPDLADTFIALANDKEDLVRSQSAYALGVLSLQENFDEQLSLELEKLLDDLHTDTRYNAALALARLGNPIASEAVAEMFDPEAIATSIASEESPSLQAFKRNTILKNALDAVHSLIEENPQGDLVEIKDALRRFIEVAPEWPELAPVPKSIVEQANKILAASANAPQ